jgi:hypothetical protein
VPARPASRDVVADEHGSRARDGAGDQALSSAAPGEATARVAAPPPVEPPRPIEAPGAHAMTLDFGGVHVPVLPGTQVEPPPGAKLVIEVDAEGRRYLRIGDGVRLGPLQ